MPIDRFVQMSSMDCHEIKGDNSLKDPHVIGLTICFVLIKFFDILSMS